MSVERILVERLGEFGMDENEREECAYIDAVFKACPDVDQGLIVDLMEGGLTVKEAVIEIQAIQAAP